MLCSAYVVYVCVLHACWVYFKSVMSVGCVCYTCVSCVCYLGVDVQVCTLNLEGRNRVFQLMVWDRGKGMTLSTDCPKLGS